MESIYCNGCKKIKDDSRNIKCDEFNDIILRLAPMDDANLKFPIKCLECIDKRHKKCDNNFTENK